MRAVRLAGIDVGTNTVLLLVAEVGPGGAVSPLEERQETPRIGREVDRSGRISPEAFERLARVIGEYTAAARSHGAGRIVACATSAVRDASNREALAGHIRERCGIGLEVLDGNTEALLTYHGALTGPTADAADPVVVDVGGGSTELSWAPRGAVNGGRKPTTVSLEIGSVRLTERYFRHSPPTADEVAAARERILEELAQVRNPGFHQFSLVGVAGTATTLAGLHLGLDAFDEGRIDGSSIPAGVVHAMAGRLLSMDAREVASLSALTAGREDILAAGALILSVIAGHFGFSAVRVSTRGLRYGIVLREWERMVGTGRFA